jgi:DNA-binding MarR family transcriptional regulator
VSSVDSALDAYTRLMKALYAERARRGADPWYECPLTLPQLRALGLIAASDRGLSGRELATTLSVGASAITPLVDRLVDRGFVQRNEDPHDRRIARLHPTASGAALIERMHAFQSDMLRDVLGHLSAAELESVAAALELLCVATDRTIAAHPTAPDTSPSGLSRALTHDQKPVSPF